MESKAVIFDLFSTLVSSLTWNDYLERSYGIADILGAPRDHFADKWKATNIRLDRGEFPDARAAIDSICGDLAHTTTQDSLDQASTYWDDVMELRPYDGLSKTLESITASERRLGLLTNCQPHLLPKWNDSSFAKHFHTMVFSCVEQLVKPDPAIYHIACERLDLKPEECIFVGDGGSDELSGASSVGMRAIQILHDDVLDGTKFRPDTAKWEGEVVRSFDELLDSIL